MAWIERTGDQEEAEIRLRMIRDDGVRSAPFLVAKTSAARDAGFPRMASVGEDLILAWTDISDGSCVRVARVRPGS